MTLIAIGERQTTLCRDVKRPEVSHLRLQNKRYARPLHDFDYFANLLHYINLIVSVCSYCTGLKTKHTTYILHYLYLYNKQIQQSCDHHYVCICIIAKNE